MRRLLWYSAAYWRYLHTPKGRYDFWDRVRAALLIAGSVALALWLADALLPGGG